MSSITKRFFTGIAWNTIESFTGQGLLLLHNYFLFVVLGANRYGRIGLIFSSLYCVTTILNLGFDRCLPSFFAQGTQSQRHFTLIILPQLFIEWIFFGIIFFVHIALWIKSPLYWHARDLSPLIVTILLGIICTETMKRSLRSLLQLSFHNKLTTFIEVSTMVFYGANIWVGYSQGIQLSLLLIFFPMLLSSSISVVFLGYYLKRFHNALPSDQQCHGSLVTMHRTIIAQRLFSFLIDMSHLFFSSNFLIPFFSLRVHASHIGISKLFSQTLHFFSSVIRKAFGDPVSALYIHASFLSSSRRHFLFMMSTKFLYGALCSVCIIMIALLYSFSIRSPQGLPIYMLAFLFIQVTEFLFFTYERRLIAEGYSGFLCALSLITLTCSYSALSCSASYSPSTFLLMIATIRILLFFFMRTAAHHLFATRSPQQHLVRPIR